MLSAYKVINHNIGLVTLKCWIKGIGGTTFCFTKINIGFYIKALSTSKIYGIKKSYFTFEIL